MRSPVRRGLLALAVLGAAVGLVAIVTRSPDAPPPNRIVPDQFVARIATEATGKAPDQETWRRAGEFFRDRGCTAASVRDWARDVYLSGAYGDLGYDTVERTLSLYSGALAREPDGPGFASTVAALQRGESWDDVVDRLLGSPEFAQQLAPRICSPDSPAYGPTAVAAPLDVPTRSQGFTGDQTALQQALNGTPAGGTLALAPRAVVRLSSTLRIPNGVTLTTTGDPAPDHYARMGRLVRTAEPAAGEGATAVALGPGARLRSVWVDGGRGWISGYTASAVTVRMDGDGGDVERSKLTNSLGGGGLFVSGPNNSVPCVHASVHGNLVTAYSSHHEDHTWSDGISVACSSATVSGNAVVDATDVGIILYRLGGGSQASTVVGNTVIAAGRSAFSALAADPLFGEGGMTFSFEGAQVRDNTLWTGARVHFDIGLAVGTRAWFGDGADKGTGASFTDNTTGSLTARVTNPFAVSGMLAATVQDNALRTLPSEPTSCPAGAIASTTGGWASGAIQGPTRDVPLSGCIGAGH